jgi:hypothetical protein
VTYDERERAGLYNGAVWERPDKLRVVLTWLDGDKWVLMSDPERSRHGGYCMIPQCDAKGQWLWDRDQLVDRLDGWIFMPNLTLAPLTTKDGA